MSKTTVRKAKEIVRIEAKADFYELKPDAKYLVILDGLFPAEVCARISDSFKHALGISVLVGDNASKIRIFELLQ
jgi:hypothetical protein